MPDSRGGQAGVCPCRAGCRREGRREAAAQDRACRRACVRCARKCALGEVSSMKKRIAIVGAGAVGGYLGGHLARTGNDVTLIDPWPEHIETIRRNGLHLSGMTDEETCT